jgi:hypothetical protein
MDTHTSLHTKLDNSKLSEYYFATRWAITSIKERIANTEKYGLNASYDRHQLERLEDMEQWLKMSWDTWMEQLTGHRVEEVSRG